jgi:O-antigen/teichoic acid export membrane protein
MISEQRADDGTEALGLAVTTHWAEGGRYRLQALAVNAIRRARETGDLWYIAAAMVVNVANFAFFGLVGHVLGPSSYGAVAALLNVVSIAAIPLNALQAAVVQETVLQSTDGVLPSLRRAGIGFAAASLVATMLITVLSPVIAGFFGLATVAPVVLLAVWFAPAISSSLYDGVLIGTLRWRPISASLIIGALVRVGVALVLGLIAPSIDGPVIATVLNAVVTLGVVLYALAAHRGLPQRKELALPIRAVLPTLAALAGYSVLVAVDTLLARHIFSHAVSGAYAAAVTVGRIALFVPMAVTVIVFPRFVAERGRGPQAQRLLLLSLTGVLALGLAAAGVLTLMSHLFVSVLFGHRYSGAVSLIGILSLEGALLGALGLLTYFHLARRSVLAAAPAVCTAAVVAVVLTVRPGPQVLARLMVTAVAACLVMMVAGAITLPTRT